MNPDFPMLDPKAISIEDYRAAVQKLLADASIPQPQFTLTWRDLSVSVPVAPPSGPENVFVAFSGCAAAIRNGCANVKHPFADADPGDLSKGGGGRTHVLDSVNGRLEPGDTCLVLGPSGSGSSLLLRRLAGRHIGVGSEESGEVLYDGEKKLAGIVKPAHIVGFVGQDDMHTPELTVRDTLKFAADCKYPEYYPYVSVLRKNHINVMADILGITRVLDTIVGDESLRGCSGGERKRVTIAEMVMSSQNGLLCLDNWSKGLDATTVLNICKSIRDYAARAKTIIVASMGAPGTDSFNTFSHLAVLDAGKLLYFGRRDEADAYFTGIGFVRPPERSVPDFISTISDPTVNGEYLRAGVNRGTIPTTPAGLEAHFKESDHGDALLRSLNEPIERKGPGVDEVPDDIVRLAQERSLQTWPHQFVSVGKRQLRVLSAKKKQFIAQVVINIIFGVILGSIFWQLPKTQGGATSRGGAIFLTSLYFGINALSQIPQMAVDKQVHLKHSASFFYMSLPYVVSLLAYDLATGLVRAVAFVVPLWLMAGMELGSGGERLLFAVLTVWQVTIIFGNFARFMVNTFDNAHAAQAISGLTTIILILTAGFLKSRGDLQAYLIWVYWMDPLHYALEALLLNEFDGLVLSCTTGELLPDNPLIADEFRICLVSTGEKYLADNFSITEGAIYRLYYFCILSAYVVVFMILAAIAVRTSKPKSFAAQAKKDAKIPEAFRSSDSVSIAVEAGDHPIPTRMTFKDMVYSVENGSKQLLSKVSGVVPPHQMIALVRDIVLVLFGQIL
jgi:ATP-binding cassette, subfamily G (WHITE), member 2, SNQ2